MLTQLEHRSDLVPIRYCLPLARQREYGRITASDSSLANTIRRIIRSLERLVRWAGIKDGWFLGTRNLGGGANVTSHNRAVLNAGCRTLSNRLSILSRARRALGDWHTYGARR